MDPAYQIPLTDEALIMLGEITVILGQVDEEMVRTVSGLIGTDRETANAVMGSTKMENNTGIWAKLIAQRTADLDILWLVEVAMKEFPVVARLRNDLIHADYGVAFNSGGLSFTTRNMGDTYRDADGKRVLMGFQAPAFAKRIRNGKRTPASEIPALRERVGRLSCLIAQIGYSLAPHGRDNPQASPWHGKLAPTIPPRPDDWEPGKAKVRPVPPRSSRPKREAPQE